MSFNRLYYQYALVLVNVALWYLSLFVTLKWWYPQGLSSEYLFDHLYSFTVIYVLWLLVCYAYRIFDLETYRRMTVFVGRLTGALLTSFMVAVVYFYFQPELILTPRRFLLFLILTSGILMLAWGIALKHFIPKFWRRPVFSFKNTDFNNELEILISRFRFLGFSYKNVLNDYSQVDAIGTNAVVVIPKHYSLSENDLATVLELRKKGFELIEYPQIYENLGRKVALSELTDLWFLQSVNYRRQTIYGMTKRLVDILISALTFMVFALTFPVVALLIKLSSPGKVFFVQQRVGKNGKNFYLYKYRTMANTSATNTWTKENDTRITSVGKWLRRLRVDEWPQAMNILKGEMSLVGPRPEQVHIVKDLKTQIPYYDERAIVKPGLTGWAQLHVYAGSLEETKEKLQYDLYYVKHRSLLFDFEIILKTLYHLLVLAGR